LPVADALVDASVDHRTRRAVVTGAAAGIGAAVAARFLDQGWVVEGWDLDPADDQRVRWSTVDVSDVGSVGEAAAGLESVDAVVNCAAIATLDAILDIDPADWNRTLAINLTGSFNVARALYLSLQRAGGVLLFVGSVNAKNTTTRRGAYSASKAAVVSLTQTIAVEWALANSGVRVLCVSPGLTRTAQATMRIESGAIDEAKLLQRVPLNRWITPDEIAAAIVSLTGPEFSALHGANVIIDAGYDAWGGHF
jgi:NAD(P)-dependent dehydrogenase (short-subunit alcohol dehydrogenase family)